MSLKEELERNTINFFLGACISADNNMTNEERLENISHLKDFIEKVKSGKIVTSERQIQIAKEGIELLQREIEEIDEKEN